MSALGQRSDKVRSTSTSLAQADFRKGLFLISFLGVVSSCVGLGVGVVESTAKPDPTSDRIPASTVLALEGPPDKVVEINDETEEWYYYNSNLGGFPEFKTPLGYRWWGPYIHAGCVGLPIIAPGGRRYRKYVIHEGARTASYSTDSRLCFLGCVCFLSREESCQCSFSCDSTLGLYWGF